jgi:hemolysin activation/secretion protein
VIEQIELRNSAPEQPKLIDITNAALAGPDKSDSPLRKCIGTRGTGMLIQRAQDALIAHGFVTSRVLAPPQDLSSGKLTLNIIAGRINAIRFDTSNGLPRATIVNTVPTEAGQVLNLRDIEQGLENFKRVPTAEADIQITPAPQGAPDQSGLVISRKQATPVRFTATVDDSGSKATGKTQGSATFSLDNPLGLSDLFYVTLSHDLYGADLGPNGSVGAGSDHGTRGNTVHYSLPMGYWLLGATYSASTYYQSVPCVNQTYVYSGSSENSEVKLSRIVWRDASAKTTLGLKAWQRKSNNYIDDTEVEVQRRIVGGLELSGGHKLILGDTTLEANLSYKRGTGDFDTISAPEESFGEGNSRFGLAVLDATVSVPFKLGTNSFRYGGAIKVQDNFSPLTPQDRFAIAGRYTVRGFDGESSLSAERGWTLRSDWSVALGESGYEAYLALDVGEVSGPIPLLEEILQPWRTAIGVDFDGYKNHVYRMVHCVFALHPCTEDDRCKVIIAAAHHDIGIWSDGTVDYLPPSIAQANKYLEQAGLAPWREEITLMIDMHHKLRAFKGRVAEQYPLVEAFRKGDLVDFSLGIFKFGVPGADVRALKASFPNCGFHKMLMRSAARWFAHHPLSPPPFMRW